MKLTYAYTISLGFLSLAAAQHYASEDYYYDTFELEARGFFGSKSKDKLSQDTSQATSRGASRDADLCSIIQEWHSSLGELEGELLAVHQNPATPDSRDWLRDWDKFIRKVSLPNIEKLVIQRHLPCEEMAKIVVAEWQNMDQEVAVLEKQTSRMQRLKGKLRSGNGGGGQAVRQ